MLATELCTTMMDWPRVAHLWHDGGGTGTVVVSLLVSRGLTVGMGMSMSMRLRCEPRRTSALADSAAALDESGEW